MLVLLSDHDHSKDSWLRKAALPNSTIARTSQARLLVHVDTFKLYLLTRPGVRTVGRWINKQVVAARCALHHRVKGSSVSKENNFP